MRHVFEKAGGLPPNLCDQHGCLARDRHAEPSQGVAEDVQWWTNCCRTLSTLVAPDHRRPADMLEAWRLEKRMHSTRAPQNVASSNQALAPVILILNVPAPMIWKSILRRTKLIWKPDMPTMLVDLVRRNNRGDHQMRHMW